VEPRAAARTPNVPRRLATKLIAALALIVIVAKGVSLWVSLETQERDLLNSITLGADQLSRSITSSTWHVMLADRRDDAYEVMQTIAEKQGIERIRMFNKDGVLMFSTQPWERLHLDESAEACVPCHTGAPRPKVKADLSSRTRVFNSGGRRTLTMTTPIYNEPSCSQAACHAHPASLRVLGVLDLMLDLEHVDSELTRHRTQTVLLMLLEVGLIGAFLVIATRRLVEKPIGQLIGATEEISEMQLDRPIRIDSSEELARLAHSFNVMRERLKAASEENDQFTQELESKVEARTAELRATQQKLMQTDRLISLGQLAASVAHEINNPIAGVLNLSMLMQRILKDDGIPPHRIEDFRRYLGQVSGETSRVGRIVSDLLSFSRRSKPQSISTDLNTIVTKTGSLVAHRLELGRVELKLELAEKLPTIRCDPSQIQQVLINLVLNGAEAIRDRGSVTVRTTTSDDGKSVILEVIDTGSGIPKESLGKIFDPFFTTKEEGKGVGLGLAVVFGIIEAHDGDIEVTSTVDVGSTFRVTLPVEPVRKSAGDEE
jgi:two-component system NtrC family sensor kinase